jgi:hypothetical protein
MECCSQSFHAVWLGTRATASAGASAEVRVRARLLHGGPVPTEPAARARGSPPALKRDGS